MVMDSPTSRSIPAVVYNAICEAAIEGKEAYTSTRDAVSGCSPGEFVVLGIGELLILNQFMRSRAWELTEGVASTTKNMASLVLRAGSQIINR